jgi:predicted phage terminase large subunit-like protein
MARASNGIYYVEDVERGQWSPRNRNVVMRQKAESDGYLITIWIEQEPGSGGKESAQISVVDLSGWNVRTETVSGDKLTRAKPFAAQVEAGNVKLVRGPWNEAYLKELHAFTGKDGEIDDQVDGSSGAFNKLTIGGNRVGVGRVTGF